MCHCYVMFGASAGQIHACGGACIIWGSFPHVSDGPQTGCQPGGLHEALNVFPLWGLTWACSHHGGSVPSVTQESSMELCGVFMI